MRLIGRIVRRRLHELRVVVTLRFVIVTFVTVKRQRTLQDPGCAEKDVAYFVNFFGDLLCGIGQSVTEIGGIGEAGCGRTHHKGGHGQSAGGNR